MTSAWAFAVAAWRRPGVEATCLELQDAHGQLPALLLWRLWTLEANVRARAFYERRGWQLDGTTKTTRHPPHPVDVGYSLDLL